MKNKKCYSRTKNRHSHCRLGLICLASLCCLLAPNGAAAAVVGWGDNSHGQTSVPPDLSDALAVAAGGGHSLAVTSGGKVLAWGLNDQGQTNVPAFLSSVVAIAAGRDHSLALKSDGTVRAWGSNTNGQATVPAGLASVTAIAAGAAHSLALKADGTVSAWGDNSHNQTNSPRGLAGIQAIACGDSHCLGVLSNGTVVAWGDNSFGQTDVPLGLTGVVSVAGGYGHSLALQNDGTVVGWGLDDHHQTEVPMGLAKAVAIAAGTYHSLALLEDGTVSAWGSDTEGETDVPVGLIGVTQIAAGAHHNLEIGSDWYLQDQPGLQITNFVLGTGTLTLAWTGGAPEFLVQSLTSLSPPGSGVWSNVLTTCDFSATFGSVPGPQAFFRVVSLGNTSAAGSPTFVNGMSYSFPGGANSLLQTSFVSGFGINDNVAMLANGVLPIDITPSIYNPTTTPLPAGYAATIEVRGMSFVIGPSSAGYVQGSGGQIAFQCLATATPAILPGRVGSIDFTLGGPGCPPTSPLAMLPCGVYQVTITATVPLLGPCASPSTTRTLTSHGFFYVPSTDLLNVDVVENPNNLPMPDAPPYPNIAFCEFPQYKRVSVWTDPAPPGPRCARGAPELATTHQITITTFPNPSASYFVNLYPGTPVVGEGGTVQGDLIPAPNPPPAFYTGMQVFNYVLTTWEGFHGCFKANGNCGNPLAISSPDPGWYFDDVDLQVTVVATNGCSLAVRKLKAASIWEHK
jgi:hypothetical protein